MDFLLNKDGAFEITAVRSHKCPHIHCLIKFQGKTVGLFSGLLIIHGLLNSLMTRYLAQLTKGFVFVNLGITFGPLFSE
jgi:hypothetical protein